MADERDALTEKMNRLKAEKEKEAEDLKQKLKEMAILIANKNTQMDGALTVRKNDGGGTNSYEILKENSKKRIHVTSANLAGDPFVHNEDGTEQIAMSIEADLEIKEEE